MGEIKIENLVKKFGAVTAVNNVSLEIEDHEFMALVGPSGCGKTTWLRMIAGLDKPTSGRIIIDGRDVTHLPAKERDIAMVFQSYALYPHMDVRKNMSFGLRMKKTPKDEIESRVAEAARVLSIEGLLDRKPKELSGGQRQRVAIGRAIVRKPVAFLFDEPLSNLDAKLRVQMRGELASLHDKLAATSIYVTHDQVEAMTLGDRIVIMGQGDILQVGAPLEVYEKPRNQFVAGFIGSPTMNFLNARVEGKGNGLQVKSDHFNITVPPNLAPRFAKALGREVVLGIRPEHLHDPKSEEPIPTNQALLVNIEVFEQLGSEVILRGHCGSELVLATVDSHTTAQLHQEFTLRVETERLHLFDKETQAAF